jgi:hypothetical protein
MYADDQRQIFTAKAKGQEFKFDPEAINRRMRKAIKNHAGGLEGYTGVGKRYQALIQQQKTRRLTDDEILEIDGYDEKTVAIACEVFQVKRFEEDQAEGWTDTELLVNMAEFWAFSDGKKKEDVSTPPSSPSASTRSPGVSRPTKTSTPSPSTGPSLSLDKPPSSPRGSNSPLGKPRPTVISSSIALKD